MTIQGQMKKAELHHETILASAPRVATETGRTLPPPHTPDGMDGLLANAKIVSFDVFDTLLIRPLASPADVFLLMERDTGITGLCSARMHAEYVARTKLIADIGSPEVTLAEIYEALKLPANCPRHWTAEALMQLELDTELSLLTRSPSISALYEKAVQAGKIIVAVSDMYLPDTVIREALRRNGITVQRVFVSSAFRRSKHEGDLYDEVCRAFRVEPHEIAHFGDNYHADCAAALKAGVAGYHVPALQTTLLHDANFNENVLNRLSHICHGLPGAEKNLFASALLAYLAQFRARHPSAPMAAVFGAMYGGPLAAGFAYWMSVVMRADGVRRLHLLTRDGYVTQDIWQRLGLPGEVSVLHSSRRLTLMPALAENFTQELASLLNTSTTITLRDGIKRLNLAGEEELLAALGSLTPLDRPIDSPGKVDAALHALAECEGILRRMAEGELEGYLAYLAQQGFDPERDALADCGWALSSQRRMEAFLGAEVKGYYIGSLSHAHMHQGIRSFLFHKGGHAAWVDIAERAVELLELPFASLEPQICRFDRLGGQILPMPIPHEPQYELVRAVFIRRMHEEMGAFADAMRPLLPRITLEEVREVLFILFDSLVHMPNSFEYHELAWLPHNREYGKSEFATIGTFWRLRGALNYRAKAAESRWRDYLRVGWISLRQSGPRITWLRAKRVLRRKRLFAKSLWWVVKG